MRKFLGALAVVAVSVPAHASQVSFRPLAERKWFRTAESIDLPDYSMR